MYCFNRGFNLIFFYSLVIFIELIENKPIRHEMEAEWNGMGVGFMAGIDVKYVCDVRVCILI